MEYDKLEEGKFFMPFDKYLRLFIGSDICLDSCHRKGYKLSSIHSKLGDQKDIFYKFTLNKDVILEEE